MFDSMQIDSVYRDDISPNKAAASHSNQAPHALPENPPVMDCSKNLFTVATEGSKSSTSSSDVNDVDMNEAFMA